MSYTDELGRELARVGIRGRLRARILAEFEDHLHSDPEARLGSPQTVADRFADELGTRRTLRGALVSFTALALAGVLFTAAFAASFVAGARWPHLHVESASLGDAGLVLAAYAPQIAFVTGLLAALRAFRVRRDPVVRRADAVLIGRRATVGVAAGVVSMSALVLVTIAYGSALPSWWTPLALSAAGIGAAALLAAAPALTSAARCRPVADGAAGDLFDDLGPLAPPPLRGRPWRFAVVVAGALAIALAIAGIQASDGYDGALRGIAEALACLGGFGLLGRYLGIR